MFYLFSNNFRIWLEAHGMGFFRVFTFAEFQGICSILLSFALAVIFGPAVINWLRRQKIGDLASFDQAEVNNLMAAKKGTPTMGGCIIIGAICITTLLLADLNNFYVRMGLLCLVWLGGVGAIDDWLKLTAGRRTGSRQGLSSIEKLMFQIGLGILLSMFTYWHGIKVPETHTMYVPVFKNVSLDLTDLDLWMDHLLAIISPRLAWINWGLITFVLMGTLVLTGSSNAVNLTDGLDGLASGCMAIVGVAFFLLSLLQGSLTMASALNLPYIPSSDQMAVLAGSVVGASLGFLWYNCNPARVFMGDTGSLALGGLIGYIAIVVRQELMLFIIGGVFVAEAVSVIMQVTYFKYTKRKYGEGRRIFLMSPLHHHFQRKGWTETQVVVRFWLLGAILAVVALAAIKLR